MARLFNSVSIPLKRRNKFDLSFQSCLTTEFGRLTPILCEPVLPNDRFQISTAVRIQFAPMVFPVMQRFTAYIHYFFVPNRLLWDKWEQFITGGEDGLSGSPLEPGGAINPAYPVIKLTEEFGEDVSVSSNHIFSSSSLFDYLGFPAFSNDVDLADAGLRGHEFDALPFKAYQLIYNEWYRDQNLTDAFDIHPEMSGVQDNDDDFYFQYQLMSLRQRAWKKDYFTSALPDPQRGPDVTLPIVGDMDIVYKSAGAGQSGTQLRSPIGDALGPIESGAPLQAYKINGDNRTFVQVDNPNVVDTMVEVDNSKNLAVSSSGMRSATINEVRRAFAVQRWYELAARAGSRYVEQILAHFGIRSSDARLQRPEYIGGSVVPILIGDVLQTSETQTTPLGTPAGIAQGAGRVKRVRRTFEEHGWILGILSVIPDAAYPQGLPRKFLKRDKFDFAWPLLANLGEQEIEKQELYFDPMQSAEYNKEGFGYAPRYSEYKFGSGQVHGSFRDTLREFHDARFFDERPALNDDFVTVQAEGRTGLNRIFAVTSTAFDHLWVNLYNDIKVRRVLPKYGTPI